MSSARLSGLLAIVSVVAGCASAETVPVAATRTTAASMRTMKENGDPLKRDADLGGNEHKLSLLEGRLTAKLHAVETPKVETHATSTKGILYTTITAKLGDDQVAYCSAYLDNLWPASLSAADLRGEHDWADDGTEKSDTEAKTSTEVTALDVNVVGGRPVLSTRGVVRAENGAVVADRKVVVTAGSTFTLICSDRSVGYDQRFRAFANELLTSLKLDPAPTNGPRRTAIYKVQSSGKLLGYFELATYVEKGVTKNFGTQVILDASKEGLVGIDFVSYGAANAKGDDSDLRVQAVRNNESMADVSATRDAKGWTLKTNLLGVEVLTKRLPAKTVLTAPFSPGWMSRMQAVATKKAGTGKIPLLGDKGPIAVVAKRQADGSVAYVNHGEESRASFDAEGLTTYKSVDIEYARIFNEGTR